MNLPGVHGRIHFGSARDLIYLEALGPLTASTEAADSAGCVAVVTLYNESDGALSVSPSLRENSPPEQTLLLVCSILGGVGTSY